MEFANASPEKISETMVAALREPVRFEPVEANGAERAARMIAQLF